MSARNNIVIIGNIGKFPEIKQVGENKVCKFSVAVKSSRKEKGAENYTTDLFNIETWNKSNIEYIEKYLKVGDSVSVSGELNIDQWTNQQGQKGQTVVIRNCDVSIVVFGKGHDQGAAVNTAQPAQQQAQTQPEQTGDDLPF